MSLFSRIKDAFTARTNTEERLVPPQPLLFGASKLGLKNKFKPEKSVETYENNVWLATAINVTASEVSRINFRLGRTNLQGDFEEVREHQALNVLRKPMPHDGRVTLTGRQLMFLTAVRLNTNGEAFWLLNSSNNGLPTEVEPLLPENTELLLDDDNRVSAYRYTVGTFTETFSAEDVVHFKIPSAKNFLRGQPPVQPLRWVLDQYMEADEVNLQRFRNNAIPGAVLESEQAMSEEEMKRHATSYKQALKGSKNANKVAAMPKGMKVKPIQQTNQEMQFKEMKELNRDEILGMFRVGLEQLGRTESQTRSNAEASNFVFQRYTILPLVEGIKDTLNTEFLPAFGTSRRSENLHFFTDEIVPENEENKRQTVQTLFSIGAITPNEAREQFGLEPVENGDSTFLPMNTVPLGSDDSEE